MQLTCLFTLLVAACAIWVWVTLGQLDLREVAMQGNIEARGPGYWRIRVFAGREEGRTELISRTVTRTGRDGQVALAKLVTEVQSGQVTDTHFVSVPELLKRWLGAAGAEAQSRLEPPNRGPAGVPRRSSVPVPSACSPLLAISPNGLARAG
jgi:hypothetical protein